MFFHQIESTNMDDPKLAREKKKELDALEKSLAYAAKMLEEENGINA